MDSIFGNNIFAIVVADQGARAIFVLTRFLYGGLRLVAARILPVSVTGIEAGCWLVPRW